MRFKTFYIETESTIIKFTDKGVIKLSDQDNSIVEVMLGEKEISPIIIELVLKDIIYIEINDKLVNPSEILKLIT